MREAYEPGRRQGRFITHNERGCTGRHCQECTPSQRTPQHRADLEPTS